MERSYPPLPKCPTCGVGMFTFADYEFRHVCTNPVCREEADRLHTMGLKVENRILRITDTVSHLIRPLVALYVRLTTRS